MFSAIIKRSKLFVGVASGLGHIANAVGTYTILIFGSETPEIVFELTDHLEPIVSPTQCKPPCFCKCNKDYYCIDTIETKTVFEKISAYLANDKNGKVERVLSRDR